MMEKFDIFGSSVCKDIAHYLQREGYSIDRCIGSIPITALYSGSLNVNLIEIRTLLKQSNADILIMDLADECMMRFPFEGEREAWISGEQENEKDMLFAKEDMTSKSFSPLEIETEWIDKVYKQFAKEIIKTEDNPQGYYERNIIVIESYYSEKWVGNTDGILHVHDDTYNIKERNDWLRKLYQILFKYIPGCQVIKFPTFSYSTENHIRGGHPLCYTTQTYEYFTKVIKVLCGVDKTNSVENFYNEQCLHNKLYTRIFNSSAIYNIGPMKREIQALQKQIEVLKKDVAVLMK